MWRLYVLEAPTRLVEVTALSVILWWATWSSRFRWGVCAWKDVCQDYPGQVQWRRNQAGAGRSLLWPVYSCKFYVTLEGVLEWSKFDSLNYAKHPRSTRSVSSWCPTTQRTSLTWWPRTTLHSEMCLTTLNTNLGLVSMICSEIGLCVDNEITSNDIPQVDFKMIKVMGMEGEGGNFLCRLTPETR